MSSYLRLSNERELSELEVAKLRLVESKNEASDCRVMLKLLDKKKLAVAGKSDAVNHASVIRQNEATLRTLEADIAFFTEIVLELGSQA